MHFLKIAGIIQHAVNETHKQHQGHKPGSHKAEIKSRAINKQTQAKNNQEQHHE